MNVSIVESLISQNNQLKQDRGTWEYHWQEISELMYPRRSDFTVDRHPGDKRLDKVFDSTPIHAGELLGSGLHGTMTNPTTTWFKMRIPTSDLLEDQQVQEYLQTVNEVMIEAFNAPKAGFTTAMHEFYMDFAVINTAIMFVGEPKGLDGVRFSTRSVAEVKIAENAEGFVDQFFREYTMRLDQMLEVWDVKAFSATTKKLIEDNKLDSKVKVLHVIRPNTKRNPGSKLAKDKAFSSIYIEMEAKTVLSSSGFDEQPMMAARFSKSSSGEVYGRGPGVSTLPDVKMLNEMMKTTIKAAQKVVDPPLLVEDDSMIGPVRAIPSGINYFRRGREKPGPLITGGQIDLGEALMEGIRRRIREAFFVDQLQLSIGPQMTATEVNQRTEEKQRLMAPITGRLQTELLDPMIDRVFSILERQGKFPPPPPVLVKKQIIPEYESPLARAQRQLEAQGLLRTIEAIGPLIDRDPTVLDNFDADFAIKHIGVKINGIHPKMIRSDEDRAQIRESRNEQQAQNQELEQAQLAATANQANANAAAAGG